uniref:Uncharacterized protein n=1 Tax=Oryza glumipatula TaxID=40148 RepID=A0A0D9ZMQ8_9ORYZ
MVYTRRKPAWIAFGHPGASGGARRWSLAKPWANMMTTTPNGVVPLFRGVVLALTSLSTKNLSHATVVIGGLLQCIRNSTYLWGVRKLSNDDTLQSLYRVVFASCV